MTYVFHQSKCKLTMSFSLSHMAAAPVELIMHQLHSSQHNSTDRQHEHDCGIWNILDALFHSANISWSILWHKLQSVNRIHKTHWTQARAASADAGEQWLINLDVVCSSNDESR